MEVLPSISPARGGKSYRNIMKINGMWDRKIITNHEYINKCVNDSL